MDPPVPDMGELEHITSVVNAVDITIANLIRHRTQLEQTRQRLQMAAVGSRFTHQREIEVFQTFRRLGPDGTTVAAALVHMARWAERPTDQPSEQQPAVESGRPRGDNQP